MPATVANSGQAVDGFLELLGQVAVAGDAVAFASVERVLAGPGAQDHFGMVQEVAIDRNLCAIDRKRGDAQPVGIDVVGRLARCTLAKEHDVGHHGGAFALEGIRWQADRPDEVGLRRPRYSRMAAFCLSSVKCVVTRASTPPGFRASMDLAKK